MGTVTIGANKNKLNDATNGVLTQFGAPCLSLSPEKKRYLVSHDIL